MFKKLFFVSSIFLTIVLVSNVVVAKTGLVGWWKFDEGSGINAYDSSGNNFTGTLVGNPQWVAGHIGSGVEFDGIDDYVDLPIGLLIRSLTNSTFAVWVNFYNTGGSWQRIFDFGRGEQANMFLTPRIDTAGPMRFAITVGGLNAEYQANARQTLSKGWHHLAVVMDGASKSIQLYIDGTIIVSTPTQLLPNDLGDTEHNWLGRSQYAADAYFSGSLDDFRIYNYALNKNEVAAVYKGEILDAEIIGNPDQALEKAYKDLREFDGWRTNHVVRQEHGSKIATILLNIAKAKEAKDLPFDQVLGGYKELIIQFPDTPQVIEALSRVVILDEEKGLAYATDFLEKCADPSKVTALYARLIKSCLIEPDSPNIEKYVKLFIDKYASKQNGLKMMAQLTSNFSNAWERQRFNKIIESNLAEDPNSAIWCAAFRQRAITLFETGKSRQLIEMAKSVRKRFPRTKLATCASAVLADNHYQQGNYVLALEVFEPGLFSEHRPEPEVIEGIGNAVALFNVNTLQTQGLDMGMLYKALAQHCHKLGLNNIAVHCYKQGVRARGFSLKDFERAASETAEHYNADIEDEIWFWKGMCAAQEGDLMTAGMICEHFLKVDDSSIFAAKAFHTLAQARMQLGWYAEAKEALIKAKSLSPCQSVIELEQELAKACATSEEY